MPSLLRSLGVVGFHAVLLFWYLLTFRRVVVASSSGSGDSRTLLGGTEFPRSTWTHSRPVAAPLPITLESSAQCHYAFITPSPRFEWPVLYASQKYFKSVQFQRNRKCSEEKYPSTLSGLLFGPEGVTPIVKKACQWRLNSHPAWCQQF
jgi:hypothetical protein